METNWEMPMPPNPWEVLKSSRDDYRVFSIRTDRARSPLTGEAYDFYVLESSQWVNVIPLTAENEVVLVQQYRHGIRSLTLEIPGGLVDEGDSPEEAARRELDEETGYDAKEMILLGAVHPNPAIQNNECFTYLAQEVSFAGGQHQDEKEDIEVVLRPLSEIPALIRNGEISHALVLAAFYRFFVEYNRGAV
jgi:8-oxo-dGTP pyrophosphatase MutT (NUDIX family)